MDEFLQKLEADQERLRQHLRGLASRFQKIGETLAQARNDRTRVFLTGEGTLEGAAQVIAEEYLRSWPVVFVSLAEEQPLDPGSDAELPDDKVVPAPVKELVRHFREGDVMLIFAHAADSPELRAVMNLARMRKVKNVVVGGLDARQDVRELYDIFIPLPTRGVKTLCESSFICARLMARCARSHFAELYDQEDARLIRLVCRECQETVFIEERFAGQKGLCPFCRKALRVPKPRRASGRRGPSEIESEVLSEEEARKRKKKRSEESRRSKRRKTGTRRHKRRSSESREASEIKDLEPEASESAEARSSSSRKRRGRGESRRSSKRRRSEGRSSSSRRSKTSAEASALEHEAEAAETADKPEEQRDESSVVIHVSSWLADAEKEESQPIGIGSELRSSGILSELRFDSEDEMPAYIADALVPSHARSRGPAGELDGNAGRDGQRVVSNRFVIQECELRFSIGDYPDESGPRHALINLGPDHLSFRLNAKDDAAATLSRGDELWVRVDIPAFLEPIYARGLIKRFDKDAKDNSLHIELRIEEIDPDDHRRLALAASRVAASRA